MPNYPIYYGDLPPVLNSLNPRHYALLLYWILFRPEGLRTYLYQADPAAYLEGLRFPVHLFGVRAAYRNLYMMLPVLSLALALLVGLPLWLMFGDPAATDWFQWGLMLVGAVCGGLLLGWIFTLSYGTAPGISASVVFGFSTASAGALVMANNPVAGLVIFAVGWGLGLEVSLAASHLAAAGVAVGIVVGLVGGSALGLLGYVSASSWAYGLQLALVGAFLVGGLFALGALRLIFYPFEVVWAWLGPLLGGRHPLYWDRLGVLPLPGSRRVLREALERADGPALSLVVAVCTNSFQHWLAQRELYAFLHEQAQPLRFLYTLLAQPALDEYALTPSETTWVFFPSARRFLLGEFGDERDYGSDWPGWLAELLVWRATRQLCNRQSSPLTRFAVLLYVLLDEGYVEGTNFSLMYYADLYRGLSAYAGGAEIAQTFDLVAEFLGYEHVLNLTGAPQAAFTASPEGALRLTVVAALERLRYIGAEMATFRDATSRVNQLAALARATDALDALDEFVAAETLAPERYLLRRVIRQWRRLVSEAGGAAGQIEITAPVANPYVAGNPVTGALFVGREDVLRRLEELWSGAGQKPSVVLYGHRRMGKSSILHNLGARFGADTAIVDFNMQRVGLVANTGELLYNLALAIFDEAARVPLALTEPDEARFCEGNPYTAFDRFLKRLEQARGEHRFIITVDEFELIEKGIADGQLEPRLLDFWRGVIQTYPWFVMAFAGLHTLEEMRRDYWNPLFGSVTAIPVSFLSVGAATRLITQPALDFPLDYDADAIERILALTNGQPYLVQLIGHGLVTRFNRQAFEEGVERERRFTLADVEAVIGAPEFFRDGDAYFTGVWRQADASFPAGQAAILAALAGGERLAEEAAVSAGLSAAEAVAALEMLAGHDVVRQHEGRWAFTVELMRRWVGRKAEG